MISNSRALAAITLDNVVTNACPLDLALSRTFDSIDAKKEQGFIQELCYGVMRWYPRLEFIANQLLEKPLKQKDYNIYLLVLLGIYQLDFMRTPEHAAVSATVDACNVFKKSWAKNLVNALLRRYQREKSDLQSKIETLDYARYAHPDWLIKRLKHDWPDHWPGILEKNNSYPPMHLRVNLLRTTREKYIERLEDSGFPARALPLAAGAVVLSRSAPVEELPEFFSGMVSVQDQGAQLAVGLMELSPGLRVLDACAAPGGKAAHIYESEPGLETLVAIDKDEARIALLETTKTRLSTRMQLIQADAANIESWWDGKTFDRILLDAPCSAVGVIRRHPDIKMLRQDEQMTTLLRRQKRLLSSLWPLLKDRGKMLYSTCSMFQQENDGQIEQHLLNHNDAECLPINANWGNATRFGRQSLPTTDDTDGFYYSLLQKNL